MGRMAKAAVLSALVLVAGFGSDSWGAARWEKQLKFTGNLNGSTVNSLVTGGVVGKFIRKGLAATWTNEFLGSYVVNTVDGVIVQSPNTYLMAGETVVYNITAFYYALGRLLASDYPHNVTGGVSVPRTLAESNLLCGKKFSRYVKVEAGLKLSKIVKPEEDTLFFVQCGMTLDKTIGYRTKLTFWPVLNLPLAANSEYDIQSTLTLNYKFGKRTSIDLSLTPNYFSSTKLLGLGTMNFNFVYDFYM